MHKIQQNLILTKQLVKENTIIAHRDQNSVEILAVSKTKPAELIKAAYKCGQKKFGESYAQEACEKVKYFKENGFNDIEWHFIGPIQSNKAKLIAQHFDVVESVDREKIAQRLNDNRPLELGKLQVLIQVNISNESQKSGIDIDKVDELVKYITNNCPNLLIIGFMGIATDTDNKQQILSEFKVLKSIFDDYQKTNPDIKCLSMGMTNDLPEAIMSGSTMVRIGTAIFGAREYHK
jgi:pyridoxal phosphate enzyme (YggS family)